LLFRIWRAFGIFCGIGAAVMLFAAMSLDWKKTADFDVIGVMWLMINAPKLCCWLLFWVFLFIGAASLLKAYSASD